MRTRTKCQKRWVDTHKRTKPSNKAKQKKVKIVNGKLYTIYLVMSDKCILFCCFIIISEVGCALNSRLQSSPLVTIILFFFVIYFYIFMLRKFIFIYLFILYFCSFHNNNSHLVTFLLKLTGLKCIRTKWPKNRSIVSESWKDLVRINKNRAINFGKLHSALCIHSPVACTDWNLR
jgi:hypothetical protein